MRLRLFDDDDDGVNEGKLDEFVSFVLALLLLLRWGRYKKAGASPASKGGDDERGGGSGVDDVNPHDEVEESTIFALAEKSVEADVLIASGSPTNSSPSSIMSGDDDRSFSFFVSSIMSGDKY